MQDYQEILNKVNDTVKSTEIKDIQNLNELSTFLYVTKEPLVLSEEESIEFCAYKAIQNLSICVDKCRDNYINKRMTLLEAEDEIKKQWKEDYNKFN